MSQNAYSSSFQHSHPRDLSQRTNNSSTSNSRTSSKKRKVCVETVLDETPNVVSAPTSAPELMTCLSDESPAATSFSGIPTPISNQQPLNAHSNPSRTKPDIKIKELKSSSKKSDETNLGGDFDCNICMETASEPVITLCGHLFCWPCLHQWLEAQSTAPVCPVCKAGADKNKIIPVYVRGKERVDPRTSTDIPNRPPGQRPRPDPSQANGSWASPFFNFPHFTHIPSFQATAAGGQFALSAGLGFGFLPLFFGGTIFSVDTPSPITEQTANQAFMSRVFLMIGLLLICSMILL